MAICSAIYKYGIDKFSFYILEIIEMLLKQLKQLKHSSIAA
jgi:hypothetical protein